MPQVPHTQIFGPIIPRNPYCILSPKHWGSHGSTPHLALQAQRGQSAPVYVQLLQQSTTNY
jgi:hypothetical protein